VHKSSAILYLGNRTNTYPFSNQEKQKEPQTIQCILMNNKYHTHILNSHHKTPNRTGTQQDKSDKLKWASFIHIGN
jgi:hypothetical protein